MSSSAKQPPTDTFGTELRSRHLVPLWQVMKGLLPPEPRPAALAYCWRYAELRGDLERAGREITAEQAERRVLLLENPAYAGELRVAATLHAGLQLLLPGETAPAHRHSQGALRFVIEGEGAFTEVGGERFPMTPGDLILTPALTWHGHGSEAAGPVVWLDGLDLPIVRLLGTTFAEHAMPPDAVPPLAPGTSLARFGSGMLPAEAATPSAASPTFHYPYRRAREALAALGRAEAPDPVHGHRLAYAHPQTGGPVMPTMAAYLQLLPAAFSGRPYRSTETFFFCAAEGRGRTVVTGLDGREMVHDWSQRDMLVVPGWLPFRHEAETEAVLFSFSDRPVQQCIGLWRERRE